MKTAPQATRSPSGTDERIGSEPLQGHGVALSMTNSRFRRGSFYALRVEGAGRTIAYSGDTEWTDTLLNVAAGADLFICEAYFFDKKIKFHLDYRSVADRKANLGCKRVVFTHMSDDVLKRLSSIEAEWAEDGKIITL